MTTFQDTYTGRASPAKTTARPSVSYETFVIAYTSLQRRNVLAVFAGVALIAGSIIRLDGWPVVVVVALGLGLAAAGSTGLVVAGAAHSDYTRRLGMTTATTYTSPPASPEVRPFVASRNGATGRVIRRGRFALTVDQWVKLYAVASRNGGKLTRDAIVAARLPRSLYGDGAWGATLADLARVGVVDAAGVVTADGWSFYENEIALPHDPTTGDRSRIVRPTATDRGDRGSS